MIACVYDWTRMRPDGARRRFIAPLAAVLMVFEAGAGGAVALVHATEPLTAPTAIESEHGQACLVLHDAARCAGCQASGPAHRSVPSRLPDPSAGVREQPAVPVTAAVPARPLSRATPPRAPPTSTA
jgi:hypothetical protein